MPLLTHANVGAQTTVDGMVNLFEDRNITPSAALPTTFFFGELACDQLPHLSFFVQQLSGNVAVSFIPQFAIRVQDGGAAQQFMTLPGGTVPASGSLLLNYNVPANFIRMSVTIPADPAQLVVRLFMVLEANSGVG